MSCDCHPIVVNKDKRSHLRLDPARITGLERAMLGELNKRAAVLVRILIRWLVKDNELALNARSFQFATSSEKLSGFKNWLNGQIDQRLLSTDAEEPWTSKFISSAYKKGVVRSYMEVNSPSGKDPKFYAGGLRQFLSDSFAAPERTDAVRLLATRTFTELQGITQQMAVRMNRVLAEGLANGYSVRDIARDLVQEIKGMTKVRALRLVRTELAYAQAEGQLSGFEDLGVEEAGLMAELSTAYGACPVCVKAAKRGPYKIEDARGMIPLHPNCRCAWLPVFPTNNERNQRQKPRSMVARSLRR